MANPSEPKKQKLPEGIAYKQFNIKVDKKDTVIHIPLRESESFLEALSATDKLTERTLKQLLREFRGVRERDE